MYNSRFLQKLQMFTSPTMFVQCLETLTVICLVSFEVSTIELAVRIILQVDMGRLMHTINSCAFASDIKL